MECTYLPKDKVLTLKITEEIDEHTTEKMRRKIDNEITRFLPRKVIFNFSNVTFMDSAGIGLIMGRYRMMGMRGDCIQATGVNSYIEKLLHLSGVYKFVEICGEV